MTVQVREAEQKDIPDIVDLWEEFMEMLPRVNPDYWRAVDGGEAFSRYLKNHLRDTNVLVAVADTKGAGLAGFSLALIEVLPEWFGCEPIGLIRYQSVSEKCRGKGAGRAMTDFMMDWFRSKGISRVELYVLKGLPAYDYWSKIGFRDFMDRRFLEI